MRRPLVAVAVALVAGAGTALAAPPEVPQLPRDCHEWNELLHIQNVRSCDDPPAAEGDEAGPPRVPVSVQRRPDGSVCVTISEQVPQCVGPLDLD